MICFFILFFCLLRITAVQCISLCFSDNFDSSLCYFRSFCSFGSPFVHPSPFSFVTPNIPTQSIWRPFLHFFPILHFFFIFLPFFLLPFKLSLTWSLFSWKFTPFNLHTFHFFLSFSFVLPLILNFFCIFLSGFWLIYSSILYTYPTNNPPFSITYADLTLTYTPNSIPILTPLITELFFLSLTFWSYIFCSSFSTLLYISFPSFSYSSTFFSRAVSFASAPHSSIFHFFSHFSISILVFRVLSLIPCKNFFSFSSIFVFLFCYFISFGRFFYFFDFSLSSLVFPLTSITKAETSYKHRVL